MKRRRPSINQGMRQAVARRSGGIPGATKTIWCHYCVERLVIDWSDPRRVRFLDLDGRSTPELDHVEPLSLGGPHTVENLVPACLSCNRSKCAGRLVEA